MEMDESEIKKKVKDGWLKVWCAIEVLGTSEDIVKKSLETHVNKIKNIESVAVYKENFKDIIEQDVEKLNIKVKKDIKKAYSNVVELEMLVKDLNTLLNIIMLYGPSSIEILEPQEITLKIDQMQNIANSVAGMLHQFASAGAGGVVVAPK